MQEQYFYILYLTPYVCYAHLSPGALIEAANIVGDVGRTAGGDESGAGCGSAGSGHDLTYFK